MSPSVDGDSEFPNDDFFSSLRILSPTLLEGLEGLAPELVVELGIATVAVATLRCVGPDGGFKGTFLFGELGSS